MDGFSAQLLKRLPLAQAAMRVVAYALEPQSLAPVYEAYRGRCYKRILGFDGITQLILDALMVHQGSGNRAFTAADERGNLPIAKQNVYRKLSHIPEGLSAALLDHGSARLSGLCLADLPLVELPHSLRHWKVVAFDGKKIKNASKRLKPVRGQAGKLLGGKLLVALDVRSGLAMGMSADPDGERNDVPLVPECVEQIRARVSEPIFWMGDRQFGNLVVSEQLCARDGDCFLVRCVRTLKLENDPNRPEIRFQDEEGRTVVQAWGWIGETRNPRRRYVRRITLERSDDPVILITDLLDDEAVPGRDLLDVYRKRWNIERMFQEVTEVFNLNTLIGASPKGMIFQASLCFLLYNVIQVLRAYVAEDGNQRVDRVSSEKLFWSVRDELSTWANLGEACVAANMLKWKSSEEVTPTVMSQWLQQTLRRTWRDRYIKAPPRRRKTRQPAPPAKVPKGHGGHTSTWRILRDAKAAPRKAER